MFAASAKTSQSKKKKSDEPPKLITVFERMHAELPEDLLGKKNHFSEGHWFNGMIVIVTLLDTVVLGLAVDANQEDAIGFIVLKMIFFMAFNVELVARTRLVGWEYFACPWNFFDYMLVVANSADIVYASLGQRSDFLRIIGALRLGRLLRLIKKAKGLRLFYHLWMVIQTMLNSANTLIWALLVLFILVYIFAVIMTTLLYSGVEDPDVLKENWQDVHTYFRGIGRSFFTVTQVITLDHWEQGIIEKLLYMRKPVGVIALGIAVMLCNFGMFNVIVGTMVKESLNLVKSNNDNTRAVLEQTDRELIEAIATELSSTGNRSTKNRKKIGGIDKDEYMQLVRRNPAFSYKMRLLGICPDDAEDLFEILDCDHSGEITAPGFIYGVQKVRQKEVTGADLLTLITFSQQQCYFAECISKRLEDLNGRADNMLARLVHVGKHFTSELRERNFTTDRNQTLWNNAQTWAKLIDSFGTINFSELGNASFNS